MMDDRHIAKHYALPVGIALGVVIGFFHPPIKNTSTNFIQYEWAAFQNNIKAIKDIAGVIDGH